MISPASQQVPPPERFTTARLTARLPRAEDAAEAWRVYGNDPVGTRYLAWRRHEHPEPLADFFTHLQTTRAAGGDGHYAWLLHANTDGHLVGSVGVTTEGRRLSCGYVIGRSDWGRGYATEALQWLVAWALADGGYQRVWAVCDVENPASARVMEKAGMEREGVLRRWARCPNLGPDLRDCLVYARVR